MDSSTRSLPSELFRYGGLAVYEGVMMRGRRHYAISCRRPDGHIERVCHTLEGGWLNRLANMNIPLIRGVFALLDTMVLGVRSLLFASQVQFKAQRGSQAEGKIPQGVGNGTLVATIFVAFLFAILLFKALPTFLTQYLVVGHVFFLNQAHLLNLLDGIIRMGLFLGYLGLVSRDKHIQRLFMYHGAEHKAINTLESGKPLTVENALQASRIHPRCGTSFAILVLALDIVVVALLPRPVSFWGRFLLQTAVVPFVAALGYEYVRLAMRLQRVRLLRMLIAPTLAAQLLTTREPQPDQLEVALDALCNVLVADGYAQYVPPNMRTRTAEVPG